VACDFRLTGVLQSRCTPKLHRAKRVSLGGVLHQTDQARALPGRWLLREGPVPRGNGSTQTCGTEQSQPTGWPAPNRQFDAPKVSGEGLATCDPVRYVRPKQTGGSGACPAPGRGRCDRDL